MSAIFRTYNDWLAKFCETNPGRLKGIAMINLDNVAEGIQELERSAKLGLVGAMITEYPAEERRYDGAEYEPFWAAAQDLNMPLSLHTATAEKGPKPGGRPHVGAHRQRAGEQGISAGHVPVRHDIFRGIRALSQAERGGGGV